MKLQLLVKALIIYWHLLLLLCAVEEYVGKGDIFNDCISHPEKYTERYVAVSLVKPLLTTLAFLHSHSIIHRWAAAAA
jgi:serine/threonine protein kinase